jgi:NADPH:quinone reductase-like Zn-dependent oxidoreductase
VSRKLGFCTVAIARGSDKEALSRNLGAHHFIDSATEDVAARLNRLGGARAVLATVTSAKAMTPVIEGLAVRGRMIACGASLVAIAHQTVPDSNGKFQREHGLEFPILDDRQGDVAVAYRIRWSPQELAAAEERLGKLLSLATETTWILPMQARYVIGRDGIIVYADINADYRQHPDPCEIVPLLREMSRAPG